MYFEEATRVRLTREQEKDVDEIVYNNPEKYANVSHFIRVAIIRLLREEKKGEQKNG